MVFPAVPEALNALQAGNCVAFLFDDTLIVSTLAAGDPKWANYEMPLPGGPAALGVGIRLEDMDAPFGKLVKEVGMDWHKNGKLMELERKWGIKRARISGDAPEAEIRVLTWPAAGPSSGRRSRPRTRAAARPLSSRAGPQ